MSPRLNYDPMKTGPQPLLSEKDRTGLDQLIDAMQANLTAAIVKNVSEGAEPLFKRGYRINELHILGFGNEITVEPRTPRRGITLWWRRILLSLQIYSLPSFRQYGEIEADERDTHRLITQLKIFETYERPAETEKGVRTYERRI